LQHVGRNCCHFFPDVLFQIHQCHWFLFIHLALKIFSDEEVLRLGTLVPMNIEVPTKYSLSQDRIIVFEIRLHSKSPMLYRPPLHGNWNAMSLTRRALKDKFLTPTVPLSAVLQNRQVFLPDPVEMTNKKQLCRTIDYSIVPWLLNMFRAILSLETCWAVKKQWNNQLSHTVAISIRFILWCTDQWTSNFSCCLYL
jgi:hypothetical protein